MDAISLSSLPNLTARFDPTVWERDNPLGIPEAYALNKEQLEVWAVVATEVRKQILKKAELYETYGGKIKKDDKKKKSKRSFPHSTAKDNVEGLRESQIRH